MDPSTRTGGQALLRLVRASFASLLTDSLRLYESLKTFLHVRDSSQSPYPTQLLSLQRFVSKIALHKCLNEDGPLRARVALALPRSAIAMRRRRRWRSAAKPASPARRAICRTFPIILKVLFFGAKKQLQS